MLNLYSLLLLLQFFCFSTTVISMIKTVSLNTVSICQCYSSADPSCLAISSLPYTYSLFSTEEFIIKQLIHSIKACHNQVCLTYPLFRRSLLVVFRSEHFSPQIILCLLIPSYQCSYTTGTIFEQVHYRYLLKGHQPVLIKTVHIHIFTLLWNS